MGGLETSVKRGGKYREHVEKNKKSELRCGSEERGVAVELHGMEDISEMRKS